MSDNDDIQMPKLTTLILNNNNLQGSSKGKKLRKLISLVNLDLSNSKLDNFGKENLDLLIKEVPELTNTLKNLNISESTLWTNLENTGDARQAIL